MQKKYVLFDLDGTLTESAPGIKRAVRYALEKLGLPTPDEETLNLFVGPPLGDSFHRYCGIPKEDCYGAVLLYREYYNETGVLENAPYEGVREMLAACRAQGMQLAVASSKPQNMVDKVLAHFDLAQYFSTAVGAIDEGVRSDKDELIREALTQLAGSVEQAQKSAVMVGDRRFDVEGAKKLGIPIIGVTYGYAPEGELEAAGADRIAASPAELSALLSAFPFAARGEGAEAPSLQEEVEKALRKRFRKPIMTRFAQAINDYSLLAPGDCVAVCISGGKDSMLMAKCFQELKRRNKFPFSLRFLVMDPGYAAENRRLIEENAAALGIPLTVFETPIFDAVTTIEKSPCYLCARMRRGYLYSKAKELGCNKIALGHHFDDVIETTLMSILYSGQTQTMMPKLHSTNFAGMELIRPMYLIREADILRWRDFHGLHFLRCACKFTEMTGEAEDAAEGGSASKRIEAKQLIATLKKTNPNIEANIFRSMENIHLNAVLGYKKDGAYHHFLDAYAP